MPVASSGERRPLATPRLGSSAVDTDTAIGIRAVGASTLRRGRGPTSTRPRTTCTGRARVVNAGTTAPRATAREAGATPTS